LGYYKVRRLCNKKIYLILILEKMKGVLFMAYELTASVHKGTCSSSSIAHNRRTIAVPHACKEREPLNIHYVDMDLEEAYHFFDKALEEYNAGKKPSRRISDYLKHITEQYEKGEQKLQEAKSRGASSKELAMIKSRYPKPYFELIVSISTALLTIQLSKTVASAKIFPLPFWMNI
jgi:hypothetical protein